MKNFITRHYYTYQLNASNKRLSKTINFNQESNNELISLMTTSWNDINIDDEYKYDEYHNTYIFFCLVNKDLNYFVKYLFISKSDEEQKFFARHMAMTLYELLQDINGLIGNKLSNELKSNGFIDLAKEARVLNKKFSEIKKIHHEILKKIRNNAAAHKDKDSIIYYNATVNIDLMWAKNLAIEVINTNTSMANLGINITNKYLNL